MNGWQFRACFDLVPKKNSERGIAGCVGVLGIEFRSRSEDLLGLSCAGYSVKSLFKLAGPLAFP